MDVPDQLRELPFPFGGVYVSCSFDRQPQGTTPLAFNVRAYEPSAMRLRGGARSGLSKYLTNQLPGHIQNLNFVVTTDVTALIGSFDADDPSYPTYPVIPIGGLFGPAFPFGTYTPMVGGGPSSDTLEDPSSDGVGNALDGSGGNGGRNRRRASTGNHRKLRRGGQGQMVSRNVPDPAPPPPPPPPPPPSGTGTCRVQSVDPPNSCFVVDVVFDGVPRGGATIDYHAGGWPAGTMPVSGGAGPTYAIRTDPVLVYVFTAFSPAQDEGL